MKYEFLQTITVDGVDYSAGQTVDADKLAKGSLESLLWTRRVCEVTPKVETKPDAGPLPVKPAAKKSQDTGPK